MNEDEYFARENAEKIHRIQKDREREEEKLLYVGKAKSLYRTNDPDKLLMRFRDDTSRFDGELIEKLARKGRVNNHINAFIMEHLGANGILTHFCDRGSDSESTVYALDMIPIESVVRNVAAGGFTKRYGVKEGTKLPGAIQEFFLKDDELHDPMISESYITVFGLATHQELKEICALSFKTNVVLSKLFETAGIQLVDFKIEFGRYKSGRLMLADEITPDGMRLWDIKTQEKLDKDRFRRDLGDVVEHYEEVAKRLGVTL